MAWPFKKPDETNANAEEDKKAQEALVAALAPTIEKAVAPIAEKVTKMQERWDALEAAANKTNEPPPNNNEPPPEPLAPELQKALTPLAIANINTNARITESEAIASIPAHWKQIIPVVKKYYSEAPIARKAQADYAGYCQNIITLVIGEAAKQSGLRQREDSSFFLEDSVSKTGDVDNPLANSDLNFTKRDGTVMTPTEQLAHLGIDPKKFADSMKKGVM